jgi:hypothetical protein
VRIVECRYKLEFYQSAIEIALKSNMKSACCRDRVLSYCLRIIMSFEDAGFVVSCVGILRRIGQSFMFCEISGIAIMVPAYVEN